MLQKGGAEPLAFPAGVRPMTQDAAVVLDTTPSTFLERGVAVPFTTPSISGARVRPSERHGLEVIIPNPSGARGSYVMPLERLDGYCRRTVHDRVLQERILTARVITPSSIRMASRQVAVEGLAGRPAAAAASAADRAEERDRLKMNFNLMLELVHTVEGASEQGRLQAASPDEIERRARAAVKRIAPTFGCEEAEIHQTLEELAIDFARIGRGTTAEQARLPQVLARLVALRGELAPLTRPADRPEAGLAKLVIDVADATFELARDAVEQARAEAANVVVMLRARFTDATRVTSLLARPDWLLDGWEQIAVIWSMSGPTPPEVRLADMVALLPLLPREAARWSKQELDIEAMSLRSRTIAMNIDWRSAVPVFDLVAQNERRRALAA